MSNQSSMRTAGPKKRAVSLDLARGTMLLLIALAHAPLYLYTSEPGVMQRVEVLPSLTKSLIFLANFLLIIEQGRCLPFYSDMGLFLHLTVEYLKE